jgi:ParB family chromosome partitioning protein
MSDTITIPLSKLVPWKGNVRRTGASDGIGELAASIAAHGLLQSLVVRKGKRGKYEIVAGQRRYLALCQLANAGTIAKDCEVSCMLAADTADATELSLAENVVRAPMHPADQFEAFRVLIEGGASTADVAARFGVSEISVQQRLKLGRLSPVILDAYRQGDIDLECAQAFTVSDDHAAQERVYEGLTSWSCQPHTIRRALTEDEVSTSDKRVRFVGLDTYRAAGGVIRQDLFSEDDEGYVVDVVLLDRLVADKLKAEASKLSGEGWKWVEHAPEADYQSLAKFSRRQPDRAALSDEVQTELDRLSEEYDALVDADDEDASDRLDEIQERIDVLSASAETWSPDTLAVAGAIVTIGYDGELRVERGLVRKEDRRAAEAATSDLTKADDEAVEPASQELSPRLVEELTAEKSAAIGAELMAKPDIALAAVVHALTLETIFPGYGSHTCLKMRVTTPGLAFSMAKPETSKPLAALSAEKKRLGDLIPGNPDDLWTWCRARSRDELLDLLAYLAGCAVDAVRHKGERDDNGRLLHGHDLAKALELDMTAWYTPTADGYFNRIRRAQIIAAIDETKGGHGPALDNLQKTELAIRAEKAVAGTGWLPEPLRIGVEPALSNDNRDQLSQAAE